jgi:hypothetical protein
VSRRGHDGPVKLKLDLHDIYNRGEEIDRALRGIIDEAIAKKAPLVEIIPGKGSGQLKKRVLRFLERKDVKALYHRVEKDSDKLRPDLRPLPLEVAGAHARACVTACTGEIWMCPSSLNPCWVSSSS